MIHLFEASRGKELEELIIQLSVEFNNLVHKVQYLEGTISNLNTKLVETDSKLRGTEYRRPIIKSRSFVGDALFESPTQYTTRFYDGQTPYEGIPVSTLRERPYASYQDFKERYLTHMERLDSSTSLRASADWIKHRDDEADALHSRWFGITEDEDFHQVTMGAPSDE